MKFLRFPSVFVSFLLAFRLAFRLFRRRHILIRLGALALLLFLYAALSAQVPELTTPEWVWPKFANDRRRECRLTSSSSSSSSSSNSPHRGSSPHRNAEFAVLVPPKPTPAAREAVWHEERELVRKMALDAWQGYVRHAWGKNELLPVRKTGVNGPLPHGLGLTIIDSLSTLYLMELDEEFDAGREWVAQYFNPRVTGRASVFEVNIRILGGLLSAFALSGDELFREKAAEVGEVLLQAFQWPSGLPSGHMDLKTGEVDWWVEFWVPASIASVGTLHLEFVYLSHVTGNPVFRDKVQSIRRLIDSGPKMEKGLFPKFIARFSGDWARNEATVGPQGDSFIEYLLKSWLQSNRTDARARRMFDEALGGLGEKLLERSQSSGLLFVAERNEFVNNITMHHLACFLGGTIALGASSDPCWLNVAKELAATCHASYERSPLGIGPERFGESATATEKEHYSSFLRPEAVETWFYLWRLTGDVKYRMWARDFAAALRRHCRTEDGFSSVVSVYRSRGVHGAQNWLDHQPSYFLAETLKYLFLIFDDDNVPLEEWVFNTEAHPLPVLFGGA